jgi:hypothetical protein
MEQLYIEDKTFEKVDFREISWKMESTKIVQLSKPKYLPVFTQRT